MIDERSVGQLADTLPGTWLEDRSRRQHRWRNLDDWLGRGRRVRRTPSSIDVCEARLSPAERVVPVALVEDLIRACNNMDRATAALVGVINNVSSDKAALALVDDLVDANSDMNKAMATVDRIVDDIHDDPQGARMMADTMTGVDVAYRDWPRREELGSDMKGMETRLISRIDTMEKRLNARIEIIRLNLQALGYDQHKAMIALEALKETK